MDSNWSSGGRIHGMKFESRVPIRLGLPSRASVLTRDKPDDSAGTLPEAGRWPVDASYRPHALLRRVPVTLWPLEAADYLSAWSTTQVHAAHKSLKARIGRNGPQWSTLSSTQMLPDSSSMVNTSLSWVSESPTGGIHRGIISRGFSNLDT